MQVINLLGSEKRITLTDHELEQVKTMLGRVAEFAAEHGFDSLTFKVERDSTFTELSQAIGEFVDDVKQLSHLGDEDKTAILSSLMSAMVTIGQMGVAAQLREAHKAKEAEEKARHQRSELRMNVMTWATVVVVVSQVLMFSVMTYKMLFVW